MSKFKFGDEVRVINYNLALYSKTGVVVTGVEPTFKSVSVRMPDGVLMTFAASSLEFADPISRLGRIAGE